MSILRAIISNPNALPPEHPQAGEQTTRDGCPEYRWGCDDNGMLLSAEIRKKLEYTVACAVNGDTGSAAWVYNDNGDWLTVSLNVSGYNGKPRWSANINGLLRGGALVIDEGYRQRIAGKPGYETSGGQVIKDNHLDPSKIVVDTGPQPIRRHSPPEYRRDENTFGQTFRVRSSQDIAAKFRRG